MIFISSSEIKIENGTSNKMLDFKKIQEEITKKNINGSVSIDISKELIHKIS